MGFRIGKSLKKAFGGGSGLGSVVGGVVGAAGSLIGAGMQGSNASALAAEQAKLQKEFAQNGISWRVADAERAGIHPLAALGAQTTGYTPVSVPASDGGLSAAGRALGAGIASAGDAYQTAKERAANRELAEASSRLQLQNLALQNSRAAKESEKIDAEIATMREEMELRRMSLAMRGVSVAALPRSARSASSAPLPDVRDGALKFGVSREDYDPAFHGQDINQLWNLEQDSDGRYRPVYTSEAREPYEDVPIAEFLPLAHAGFEQMKNRFFPMNIRVRGRNMVLFQGKLFTPSAFASMKKENARRALNQVMHYKPSGAF